ncbi:hypothetical protein HMPREF1427_00207 [Helicobacter pylori GAM83Bi]|uniref:hypothetical protein n=1 Tax=Helicobacter pylori TaxID=210 RepID=UPI0002B957A4|nr:hypothetical protein [Helicobacter pylori]EMH39553.1 hypothetical protein HMPREF1427_00207 [Helicobacter pylori GAM83Bi]EMH39585.1 hypothetical protein HMPREF1428_00628 [Helicobacter pylori GAM83T]
MAYFESITAGRGGLDSFNQALNNQRYANLLLNESMGHFANTIANAGSLFDNAKIREEAVKYQRMRDLANDKKQAEAFDLQKRQAEQSMDLAKRQQVMNEEIHKQIKRLNDHKIQALAQENRFNKQQQDWLMEATAGAKASVSVGNNNAMKTPTPRSNALSAQGTPKPKTITKEEFKAVYANPMFRF